MRRAHGGFRVPRSPVAVRGVCRGPREDKLQEIALLALDDARPGHTRADLPENRHGAALFAQEPQQAKFHSRRS